ncbi:putative fatty acid oxygenase [Polychaeton citri CBS 116435]|uniref:Fatty acid oxygenase n=1 Tax=Polychaeton citri CBS 116435 TaxID=1314669 RepID=A0A9P4Q108_9PEZI|nr:putative fatty acid oxygenase [Polychaeton citri CBS 116435]
MSILDRVLSKRRKSHAASKQANGQSNGQSNGQTNGTASSSAAANGSSSARATGSTNGATNGVKTNGAAAKAPLTPVLEKKPLYPSGKSENEAQGRYPDPPDHGESTKDIKEALDSFTGLVSHMMRPLPDQTGNGKYIEHEEHASWFQNLKTFGIKDMKTLKDKLMVGDGPVDDKTMLMERVIQLVVDMPDNSLQRNELTNQFVDQLFNTLQHPPLSYLGDQFKYRQADGSYNNVMYPHLGAANTPYARTVYPETIQPGARPDPGLIFDSLFAREKFEPHPNKNSSIIFYWASLVIHDLFQTDHADYNNSQTSSYLDLSPLYGDTQEDQDTIRTFKDGKLKPDCFAEHRLLLFPPGCGVLLIMFNRFHNYVAEQLALINEGGRFNKPREGLSPQAAEKAWKKHDNDLFQTARLVTSGLYMNITLIDYVRTIVNVTRSNSTWTLDPRVKMGDTLFNGDGTPRGIGNQVSAEFNLVYRWHSAISEKDEKWTQGLFKKIWGKPAEEITEPELLMGMHKLEMAMPADPHERDFNGLKRDENGCYNDDELVEIITSSIEDVAGRFGPNHVPKALKCIEILGMKQARMWDVASLNEFRKFFGLKAHETFEDINPDPKVADQFRHLYEQPDRVELYPGLVAEAAKQPMHSGGELSDPGVGICPTYTISRAILSDAVALVRGDRFYTIDYHPKNLTNWGFSEVQYDMNVEQGCSFYKLFIRAFPEHFEPNSIYAHHPMTIPEENRNIMRVLGRESHYSWARPRRIPKRVSIQAYSGVTQIMKDNKTFEVINDVPFTYLYGPRAKRFMLCGDGKYFTDQKSIMQKALYRDGWHEQVKEFYEFITLKLLKEKSCKIAGINQIDMTRDVGNLAHTHFVANVFSLPLKTVEHPRGVYSEQELYLVMAAQFVFLFFDVDPVKSFPLALGTYKVTQQLAALVLANVNFVSKTGWLAGITDRFHQETTPLKDYGVHMVRKLLESGLDAEEVVHAHILGTAGAMVANQSQVFTQILEYYMQEGHQHWPEIQRLADQNTTEAEEKLLRYCLEANRLKTTFGGYRRAACDATINDTGFQGYVDVKKGDKVFMSFVKASRDPSIFPEPDTVRLDRDLGSYVHYGMGQHRCLGESVSKVALTAMLKTVARLKNLRPAPGPQGQIKKVDRGEGFYAYMTEDWGKMFPFPLTWKMHFDGEVPEK